MKIYSLSDGMKDISVRANDIRNRLPIGTVLFLNGYGDHKKVIVGNLGVTSNYESHGAIYELVDLVNYTTGRTDTLGMQHISEKKDNRIAMYYTDQVLTPEEVLFVVEQSKLKKQVLEQQKIEKEQKSKELIEKIKQENPGLELGNAPKNIRIELKKAFKGVKFSVRSDHSSIRISWQDGPTQKEVEKITSKYQKGHFNGMEDIYEYDNAREWTDTFGGAQYITESRHYSDKALKEGIEKAGVSVEVKQYNDGSHYLSTTNYDDQRKVYAYIENKSFLGGN